MSNTVLGVTILNGGTANTLPKREGSSCDTRSWSYYNRRCVKLFVVFVWIMLDCLQSRCFAGINQSNQKSALNFHSISELIQLHPQTSFWCMNDFWTQPGVSELLTEAWCWEALTVPLFGSELCCCFGQWRTGTCNQELARISEGWKPHGRNLCHQQLPSQEMGFGTAKGVDR